MSLPGSGGPGEGPADESILARVENHSQQRPPQCSGLAACAPAPAPAPIGCGAGPQLQELIANVLRDGLMRDGRTFDPITRPAAGGEWRTVPVCLEPLQAAQMVLDPALVIGLRHRASTRLVAFDIDAHHPQPSPYWSASGPDASPAHGRLLTAAAALGAVAVTVRTASGGWHLLIVLPEAVPVSEAAWLARILAARADLQEAPGRLEVFPTALHFDVADPRQRQRSQGFRLPGQAGAATWLGGPIGWCEEPETAWLELAAGLELAAAAAAEPAWLEVRAEAHRARARAEARRRRATAAPWHRRGPRLQHGIAWTGPGQSNGHLGALANALYAPGQAPEALGAAIAAAARACPGFDRWASPATKRALDSWALSWARCCHRRPPAGRRRSASADPGRNHRLHREAVCRVIDRARLVAAEHGQAALSLAERQLAQCFGLARNTLRKLLPLVRARLAAALYPVPAARGSHPRSKVGDLKAIDPSPLAAPLIESQSLPLSAPPEAHAPPPASPPPLPTRPADRPSPRRAHERAELLRWLAGAAA